MSSEGVELHRGRRFVVRRGRRDGASCIFKTPIAPRSDADAARLRREHAVLLSVAEPGVERPLALEEDATGTTLVLEDAGPSSLAARLAGGPLSVAEFLPLALDMARALGAVHEHRFLHGDVCPENFVLDAEGRSVTLVDFELAAEIGADGERLATEGLMEATLAYVAPERTGRLSAPVDHRADLYSLGATFYEMLTGAPPFEAPDAAGLVHAHVAKAPAPPSDRDASIPRVLDDLVLELLAKMPELRYQSAGAVAGDLAEALRRLERTGRIEPFELGYSDAARTLVGSGALFGRERELRTLRAALARVREGANELWLVTGPSGIGKTALVTDAFSHYPFVAHGKFDPLRGDVPFGAVREAFGVLFARLERTPPAVVESMRRRARDALGPMARSALALVPALERLLGPRPVSEKPGPSGGELQAHVVIRALVQALAGPETPLVLALDDLQWAGSDTLDLLRSLAAAPEVHHLLVVGAFRPEDVSDDHPLERAFGSPALAPAMVRRIDLQGLELEQVERYCTDLLGCTGRSVRPLATYVAGKTGGNPLFARRLLSRLYHEQLVTVDASIGRCDAHLDRITRTDFPDDLFAFMAASLSGLPEEARRVVATASCFPGSIDLEDLAAVSGLDAEETVAALEPAVRDSLLVREAAGAAPPAFRFVHDRVRQAAYALLGGEELSRIHLAIGRRGLARISSDVDEPRLFEVTDAMNRGSDLLVDSAERLDLARLNRRAGEKARRALAFGAARAYLRRGLAVLPADAPRTHRADWLELVRTELVCAYRAGDCAGAEAGIDAILPRLETPLEIAEVLRIRIDGNMAYSRPVEAIAAGREALRQLGSPLPERIDRAAVHAEVQALERRLRALPREALLSAPPLAAGRSEASMHILASLFHPAWLLADEALASAVVARMVALTLDRGVGPESGPALAYFGIVFGAMEGDATAGYEDARVGLELAHQAGDRRAECQARVSVAYAISPFRLPLRECLDELAATAELAWDSGDLLYFLYTESWRANLALAAGIELPRLVPEFERWIAMAASAELRHMELAFSLGRQVVRCLEGKTSGRGRLEGEGFDPEAFGAEGGEAAAKIRDLFKLELANLFRDFEAARSAMIKATSGAGLWPESHLLTTATFYGALTLAAMAERNDAERPILFAGLSEVAERIGRWALRCPENFLHQELLVRAEIARLEGRIDDARDAYGRAIGAAARQGILSDEALSHELAGRFEMAHGGAPEAELHIRRAMALFAHWGADEKARALAEEFPALAPSASFTALRAAGAEAPLSSTVLDVLSLVKFSEALASEVVLERLIEKLLAIALEAAGAERGALVLVVDGEPEVRAIGTSAGPTTLAATPLADSEEVPRDFVQRVLGKMESVVVDDVARDPSLGADAYVKRAGVRCAMALPIRGRSEILGTLYLENRLAAHAFAPDRVRLLQLLSTQIAISLENGLLFEKLRDEIEERRRAERAVRFLADASVTLAEAIGLERTAETVAQLPVPFLADWCTVDLLSGGSRITRVTSRHADPKKDALLRELAERYPPDHDAQLLPMVAVRAGEPRLLHDVPDALLDAMTKDARHAEIVRALGSRSALAVPLVARNRRIGVITLHASPGRRRYDAADVPLVEDLARRAAIFIDNARLEAELRQSQKLEAIGRLAGGVAHDFNNLLTVVLSFADLLKREISPGSRAADWLAQIHGAGERAASLTRQLLAFGRSQVLTPTVLDLNEVVRSLAQMLRRVVGEHIEMELALGSGIGHVRADVTQLEQVIVNLVANARDAMPGGGKLTIETAEATLDTPPGAPAEPYVRLSVRDTGVGMDRETRERIFEPFFTTKKAGEGAGLGLATVLGIVSQSEGRMAVRSELGQGSTFDVYLPRVAAPAPMAEPADEQERPSERAATILVVEDDAAVLKALRAALGTGDFEVLSASRGEEALRVAAEHAGPIDVLVTDVIMPGMRGPDLARRLRERRPELRVLFLSGHGGELSETTLGGARHLAKPVTRDELVRAVNDALARPARHEP